MAKQFTLTDDCHTSMVTFGNQVNWIMKKGEKMIYNFVKEANNSFIVLQSGLNYYVLETRCCPPISEHQDYDT